MPKQWPEWTDQELSDEAQQGLRGQGAVVEAMRRLREAIVGQQQSSNFLAWMILIFSIVTAALMIFQLARR